MSCFCCFLQYLEKQKELQPLSGAVEAVEVAKAIKFFASDESTTVTGQIMFIDGGRSVMS